MGRRDNTVGMVFAFQVADLYSSLSIAYEPQNLPWVIIEHRTGALLGVPAAQKEK